MTAHEQTENLRRQRRRARWRLAEVSLTTEPVDIAAVIL
jgi:hypothetical protein